MNGFRQTFTWLRGWLCNSCCKVSTLCPQLLKVRSVTPNHKRPNWAGGTHSELQQLHTTTLTTMCFWYAQLGAKSKEEGLDRKKNQDVDQLLLFSSTLKFQMISVNNNDNINNNDFCRIISCCFQCCQSGQAVLQMSPLPLLSPSLCGASLLLYANAL